MAQAKATAGAKRAEKAGDAPGIPHITATCNNTLITITDMQGNAITWGSSGKAGFQGSKKSTPFAATVAAEQAAREGRNLGVRRVRARGRGQGVVPGLEEVAAVRGGRGRGAGGARGAEPGRAARARAGAGARLGPRVRHPGAGDGGPADPVDPRRDPDSAQRLPPAQETAGLSHGTLHRSRLQAVPPRGHQAVSQGHALPHREVRGRAASLCARAARPVVGTAPQGVRLSAPAAREAESEADLRALGAPVPQYLRRRAQGAGSDG